MKVSERIRFIWSGIAVVFGLGLVFVAADIGYMWLGSNAKAQEDGQITGLAALHAPVHILRDERGIPHIRAANRHDLFFAQGYAEGADRMFQMDLLRHLVYGRLAEFFGNSAVASDEEVRTVDLRGVFKAQWGRLDAVHRDDLTAFAAGVNAAREREPLPFEYRVLHLRPEAWQPMDTIAAGFATALVLIDPWDDIIKRYTLTNGDRALADAVYPLSDPGYDVPTTGSLGKVEPLGPLHRPAAKAASAAFPPFEREERQASNDWAVGAAHSSTGRSLLANDPHLAARMPGVWYLVDLKAGDYHAAGAALAGTLGITLGHNETIAWGVTNGTTCSESVYTDPLRPAAERKETFLVRFDKPVEKTYYRTSHGFVASTRDDRAFAVDWDADRNPQTPLNTFDSLARSRSLADAHAALTGYTGPTQNFVLADATRAMYQLAGPVPDDPMWCLGVHGAKDPHYPLIPLQRLPHVDPSRDAIVFTANNRVYGAGYPDRLTAGFGPPYRASRIAGYLRAKPLLSIDDFMQIQRDTISIPDADLAKETVAVVDRKKAENDANHSVVEALRSFTGDMAPGSATAPTAFALRRTVRGMFDDFVFPNRGAEYFSSTDGGDLSLMMRVLRERPAGWIGNYDQFFVDAVNKTAASIKAGPPPPTWREENLETPRHPFALLGLHFWDGVPFPGRGSGFTPRVQSLPNHAQSFRAIWDVGNWDAGGIVIPEGESGRPGSGHYTDLAADWNGDKLVPLPFSDDAVKKATRHELVLSP